MKTPKGHFDINCPLAEATDSNYLVESWSKIINSNVVESHRVSLRRCNQITLQICHHTTKPIQNPDVWLKLETKISENDSNMDVITDLHLENF